MAGYDFNVGSTKQLGQVLFEKLKLPTGRKNKNRRVHSDSDVLEKTLPNIPFARKFWNGGTQ